MLLMQVMSRCTFLGAVLSLYPVPFRVGPEASSSIESKDIDYTGASIMVRSALTRILDEEPTLAGPMIRLAFHDAITIDASDGIKSGGPNGSIRFEILRGENRAITRPLSIVEATRFSVDCRLSLADCIALAGACAVEHAGGPTIPIQLGRKDSDDADPVYLRESTRKETERSLVEKSMPSPALDSDGLRLFFGRPGLRLTEEEFVALSGSHGLGRHVSLLHMPKPCLKNLTRECLENAPTLLPFVSESVDHFDNSYFRYLIKWNNQGVSLGEVAFIPTDVALVVDPGLRRHVEAFASDNGKFRRTFVRAYQKVVESTATTSRRY